jgi:ABC-type antimicrobial peptide transport system permease subunit
MRDFIHGILKQSLAHPARSAFLIIAVAMGALSFAVGMGLSSRLDAMRSEFSGQKTRFVIGGGAMDSAGGFDWKRPGQFNKAAMDRIKSEIPQITAISQVNDARFQMVTVNDVRYNIRSVLGVNESYAGIMNLSMKAGRSFNAQEEGEAAKVAVISESLASVLFGGTEEALKGQIKVSSGVFQRANQAQGGQSASGGNNRNNATNARRQFRMETVIYSVVGVYADPSEFMRTGFGVPDAIIPFSSSMPAGFANQNFASESLVARTDGIGAESLRNKTLAVLDSLSVKDPQVEIWEGNPRSPMNKTVESTKKSMFVFSTALIALSFVILALSAVGVFSSVNTEVADATKSICVRRALGADRGTIARTYILKGLGFGLAGGFIGALGAYPAFSLVSKAVSLALERLGLAGLEIGGLNALFLFVAIAASSAMSVLFSLIPAVRASRLSIVEGLKEL